MNQSKPNQGKSEQSKAVAIKKIRSAGPMRELMAAYFKELDEAAKTGTSKVAWCTSVGPAELLRAFGTLRIVFYALILTAFIVFRSEGIMVYAQRKYQQFERWVRV